MADIQTIKIPDIGGAKDVDVIEILVQKGDTIKKDQGLITLEGDKATMEVPAPFDGVVEEVSVKIGDKVSEGSVIMRASTKAASLKETTAPKKADTSSAKKESTVAKKAPETQTISTAPMEVSIPDIGGAKDVDVIEILVKKGDSVTKDQGLLTLEGDKATMEIPAPCAGTVESVLVQLGDKVSEGTVIMRFSGSEASSQPEDSAPAKEASQTEAVKTEVPSVEKKMSAPSTVPVAESGINIPASPAVRRLARELGVQLTDVQGSGRKSRITTEDIHVYVKKSLQQKTESAGMAVPAMPVVDFSQFGDIEIKPLNKIKKLTGINVHRSWITIPHVTQFDETDITDLETFRKEESAHNKQADYKLTILAFVCKAVSKALAQFPQFNASLDAKGENLIYKQYCNIGIAVETPQGLVVPVIKDVSTLSVVDIAREMARLSSKARDKGLMPADMSGGCFTISSLGGIGGTAFTPIVNAPEVAILGLSRSSIKPVYINNEFKPRLMLPLSLSYDHRVIDGAEAARFTRYLCDSLQDIRRILL